MQNTNNELVSVIVPVYKVEPYLDRCVASILAQTYPNLEVILVDDGSPDNCPALCDAWAQRDARIRVIHKKNGGISDARNVGLDAASGAYISFVDSDDYIAENFIETLYDLLHEYHTDISAVHWKLVYADAPKPRQVQKAQPKPEPKPVFDDVPPWEQPTPPVSEPAPEPESTPAPTGAFDWQALCAYMEQELPVGIYYFLLDPLQATGELRDGTLTLHFSQQMVYPMFNKPEIAEKFRLAVQKLTGQNVRVVMQPMDTVTQINQRKIEELAHFPNVTIR